MTFGGVSGSWLVVKSELFRVQQRPKQIGEYLFAIIRLLRCDRSFCSAHRSTDRRSFGVVWHPRECCQENLFRHGFRVCILQETRKPAFGRADVLDQILIVAEVQQLWQRDFSLALTRTGRDTIAASEECQEIRIGGRIGDLHGTNTDWVTRK